MGAGCLKNQLVIRGLEFSVPPLDLWGGERGCRLNPCPKANVLISHTFVIKPVQKNQKEGVHRASRWVSIHGDLESGTPGKSMETLPFPIPCPMHLFHLALPGLL